MASVLLSASVERCFVSRVRDFFFFYNLLHTRKFYYCGIYLISVSAVVVTLEAVEVTAALLVGAYKRNCCRNEAKNLQNMRQQ